jgi:hypothetical protein
VHPLQSKWLSGTATGALLGHALCNDGLIRFNRIQTSRMRSRQLPLVYDIDLLLRVERKFRELYHDDHPDLADYSLSDHDTKENFGMQYLLETRENTYALDMTDIGKQIMPGEFDTPTTVSGIDDVDDDDISVTLPEDELWVQAEKENYMEERNLGSESEGDSAEDPTIIGKRRSGLYKRILKSRSKLVAARSYKDWTPAMLEKVTEIAASEASNDLTSMHKEYRRWLLEAKMSGDRRPMADITRRYCQHRQVFLIFVFHRQLEIFLQKAKLHIRKQMVSNTNVEQAVRMALAVPSIAVPPIPERASIAEQPIPRFVTTEMASTQDPCVPPGWASGGRGVTKRVNLCHHCGNPLSGHKRAKLALRKWVVYCEARDGPSIEAFVESGKANEIWEEAQAQKTARLVNLGTRKKRKIGGSRSLISFIFSR